MQRANPFLRWPVRKISPNRVPSTHKYSQSLCFHKITKHDGTQPATNNLPPHPHPATLNTLLRDLPETWTLKNEGENTWSVFAVIALLIHGERADWMSRAKTILQSGESQTFAPFDRLAHVKESQNKSLNQLLDEFAASAQKTFASFIVEPPTTGPQAPRPTSAFGTVTLSQLLATLGRP